MSKRPSASSGMRDTLETALNVLRRKLPPSVFKKFNLPEGRSTLAFLAAKVSVRDYTAERLSPTAVQDEYWHALMLRPALYAAVCDALEADKIIDHNPDGAEDPPELLEQRRRAAKVEVNRLDVTDWIRASEAPLHAHEGSAPEIRVTVSDLAGKKTVHWVNTKCSVACLKHLIEARRGVPKDAQWLVYDGNRLVDEHTIAESNLESGATVHLILRVGGC